MPEREVGYQQRRGESEHAVAEAFHPALVERPASARRVSVSCHGTVSFAPVGRRRPSVDPGRPAGSRAAQVKPARPAAVAPRSSATVNPDQQGTKCAFWYRLTVALMGGAVATVRLDVLQLWCG